MSYPRNVDSYGQNTRKSNRANPRYINAEHETRNDNVEHVVGKGSDVFNRRSRSRSRSISRDRREHSTVRDDNLAKTVSKAATTQRRSRFLQRWSESADHVDGSPDIGTTSTEGQDKEPLPYIYQQAEFIRISTDLIRKCDCLPELQKFLSTLDEGGRINLDNYADAQMRKKFRHLGKALYLSRDGSFLTKPVECNISLLDALEDKLPYIRQKAEAKGPYLKPTKEQEEQKDASFNEGHKNLTENEEMMSLREMHEQGFFVGYENIQKEFMNKHAIHDVWGKTPQQQLQILGSNECKLTEEEENLEPWKVFDREKEIVAASKIDRRSYNNLLDSSKDFLEGFTEGKKHSSFI